MKSGQVTHYNAKKGYGFIRPNDGTDDVFFHISVWQLPHPPKVGQSVFFLSKPNHKKQPAATQVSAENSGVATKKQQSFKRMSLSRIVVILLMLALAGWFVTGWFQAAPQTTTSQAMSLHIISTTDAEIEKTLMLIQQGGPFPYPQKDGTTFYNREGKLPIKDKGYYREYTVITPGISHRGARRIVTGGKPPEVYYFTQDHYQSFQKLSIKEP